MKNLTLAQESVDDFELVGSPDLQAGRTRDLEIRDDGA